MTQPSLLDDATLERRILDRAAAVAETEAGVRKAAKKIANPAAEAWQASALAALQRVAAQRETLTSDDVWQALGEVDERYASQMGLVFRAAKKAGLIASTALFQESQRPSRHRCGIRVWHSLIRSGR